MVAESPPLNGSVLQDGQADALAHDAFLVEQIGEMLTMQLGPDQALLTVKIKFRQPLTLRQLESAIQRLEAQIREKEPTMERIFIEPDSLAEQFNDKPEAA